jgi:hypothetical protein
MRTVAISATVSQSGAHSRLSLDVGIRLHLIDGPRSFPQLHQESSAQTQFYFQNFRAFLSRHSKLKSSARAVAAPIDRGDGAIARAAWS